MGQSATTAPELPDQNLSPLVRMAVYKRREVRQREIEIAEADKRIAVMVAQRESYAKGLMELKADVQALEDVMSDGDRAELVQTALSMEQEFETAHSTASTFNAPRFRQYVASSP